MTARKWFAKLFSKYFIVFILFTILFYLFPYSHDDWGWGSQRGAELLSTGFNNYGGRYVGYLITLAITRSVILKSIFMSGVVVGIAACIESIVNKKWSFWLSILLFSLMPISIFREGIAWISAFANYGTSTLVVLLFLSRAIKILRQEKVINNPFIMVAFFLLGFLGSMILEYVTLYLIVASIALIIFYKIKYKHVDASLWIILVGAIAGATLMFTNPVYTSIAHAEDGYRSIAKNGMRQQMLSNYTEIYRHGFLNNIIINLGIYVSLFAMFIKKKIIKNKVAFSQILLFGLFVCYSIVARLQKTGDFPNKFLSFESVFAFVAALSLLISIFFILKSEHFNKNFLDVAFVVISILILIAPLIIINPIGPRCFVINYMLFTLLCFLLMRATFNIISIPRKAKDTLRTLAVYTGASTLIGAYVFYVIIYGTIHISDMQRATLVEQTIKNNGTAIELKELPFKNYLHFPSPANRLHEQYFRSFYHIPDNIIINMEGKSW